MWAVGLLCSGLRFRYWRDSQRIAGSENNWFAHACEKKVSMTDGVTSAATPMVLRTMVQGCEFQQFRMLIGGLFRRHGVVKLPM